MLILSKIFTGIRAGESHVTSFKQNCLQLQVNKNSEDGKNHATRFKQNCLQVNKNSEDGKKHVTKFKQNCLRVNKNLGSGPESVNSCMISLKQNYCILRFVKEHLSSNQKYARVILSY